MDPAPRPPAEPPGRVGRGVFSLALAGLVLLPLLPTPALDGNPRAAALMDLAHLPLAGLLALVFHRLLLGTRPKLRLATVMAIAAGLALVVCVGIEGAQALLGTGQPSLGDLTVGLLGIACGFLFLQLRASTTGRRIALAVLMLVALAWPMGRAVWVFREEAARFARFPSLALFERSSELLAWRGLDGCELEISRDFATSGAGCLALNLEPTGHRPAALLADPPPDWSRYDHLALEVFNPDREALALHLKITDKHAFKDPAERFVHRFVLPEGFTTIRLPLGELTVTGGHRRIDLSQINTLVIFFKDLPKRRVVYLDHLRLEGG